MDILNNRKKRNKNNARRYWIKAQESVSGHRVGEDVGVVVAGYESELESKLSIDPSSLVSAN